MSDVAPKPPPDKPPASFGRLAKKIRGRTSDLLAIVIVVAGGFAVGSQVSRWWDKPEPVPPNTTGNSAAAFGEAGPLTLDFGSSPYSMIRTVTAGNRKSATQQLVDECLAIAATAPFPAQPPSPAEAKLLARVKSEKPLLTGDSWRLFRVEGPLTMVSVIREPRNLPADANASPRVVCWGLAFPAGEKRWVLYRFVAADGSARAEANVAVPLPASAAPLLTIRGRDNLWRTFRSEDPVESVRRFYTGWFRDHGWTETASNGDGTAAFAKDNLRAEVQISPEGRRGCAGLIVVTGTIPK